MKSKIYEDFVEKFKSKKTTDDCYTPPKVYGVILDWVCKEYNIDKSKVCRPFIRVEIIKTLTTVMMQ